MHDYDFFIKPPERIVAYYEHTPRKRRPIVYVHWLVFGIVFFLLPVFLSLQLKGLLLWLILLVLVVRHTMRHSRPYDAVLTTHAVYKVHPQKKLTEWRIPLASIEEIRVRGGTISIKQRKRVYLLNINQDTSDFGQILRDYCARKSEPA